MSASVSIARRLAQWTARSEIPVLALFYLYFLISDRVPVYGWALIGVVWAARAWTAGALTRWTRLDIPIAIMVLWMPASLWASTDWGASLPKIYGVILSVLFFYSVVNHVSSRRDLAWASAWLVVASIAIALAGLVGTDWAQGHIISLGSVYDHLPRIIQGLPRSIAGGFDRNGVGGTLTLTVPLLASFAFTRSSLIAEVHPGFAKRQGWLVAFALALSLVTLVLTQSRGAWLGTAIGLTALAVERERRLPWLVIAGAVCIGGVALLGFWPAVAGLILKLDAANGTIASRLEVWGRGVMMVQDFPFTGIGIGTYNEMAHALYPFFLAAPNEVVAHAHNTILQVAVDAGLPVLVAYIALLTGFAIAIVRGYRMTSDPARRALLMGLGAGMLAHQVFGLTDAFMLGTKPGVLLWVFFALAIAILEHMNSETQPASAETTGIAGTVGEHAYRVI
ncbi:MAG: O-antigen ligase family protein [Chloroflexi bacterium]|nr:O-antigen ligase family protein [Chloroflexota bacterium]